MHSPIVAPQWRWDMHTPCCLALMVVVLAKSGDPGQAHEIPRFPLPRERRTETVPAQTPIFGQPPSRGMTQEERWLATLRFIAVFLRPARSPSVYATVACCSLSAAGKKGLAWRHLLRRLLSLVHAIVAHHGGNADPVIAKDPLAPRPSRAHRRISTTSEDANPLRRLVAPATASIRRRGYHRGRQLINKAK